MRRSSLWTSGRSTPQLRSLALGLVMTLSACSPQLASQTPETRATATSAASVPSSEPTPTSTVAATATPTMHPMIATHVAWLTSTPRDLEDFGFRYDGNATPVLPPGQSVNMPIWGQSLPLRPLRGYPQFIAYPEPVVEEARAAQLAQAGCEQAGYWDIVCDPASPVAALACEDLLTPTGYYTGLDHDVHVLAICRYSPEDEEEERDAYLYRSGCAFRGDVAYIIEDGGEYLRVDTPEQVRALLVPIEDPDKAMTYVEMMTGLTATFSFEREPDLIYFQDPVEGTRVTEREGVYTLNMFHYQGCLCEPWVNSVVNLTVNREGEITWLGATPWSMTLGFSCAD